LQYVKTLRFSPGDGRFTADEAEERRKGKAARRPPPTTPPPPPKKRSASRLGRLLPRDLVLEHKHEKLSRLIGEGQKLNVEDFPHASAFLLRTLLETALIVRLKAQRLYGEAVKRARSSKLGPTLAEMLDYVNHI